MRIMNTRHQIKDLSITPEVLRVSRGDSLYPKRLLEILRDKAPDTLYLQGNIDLLRSDSIGFCGARKSSRKGIDAVKDCVEQAAAANITVVSGNAAGIDFQAHYHALATGGRTILVLPEGINHFRIRRALAPVWNWSRILVVSQFKPDDSWKGYRAMIRNRVIIGLSKAIVVIEASEKGGTMEAGKEAIKRNTPLYVAEYKDMSVDTRGNEHLLKLGGRRLARSRSTERANMSRVFENIRQDLTLQSKPSQVELS